MSSILQSLVVRFNAQTLARQLFVLIIATALPLLACAALMAERLVSNERDGIRQGLMVNAKTLANLVDNEIDTHAAIASTLAASPNLQRDDLTAFWSEAKQALSFVPGTWLAVSVPDGPIVLNTLAPVGTAFPNHAAPDVVRRGFETRSPQVGNLVFGPVAKRPTAFVEVPVFRDGKPVYSLSIALPPERMLGLVKTQFTNGAVVGIIDRNGRFVARVPDHERRVGQLASDGWRAAIASQSEGWVENLTVEGDPSLTAYSPAKSGWTVGVAVLESRINGPVRAILWSTVLLASGLLLLSALMAVSIAGRTGRGMASLAAAARDLQTGDIVEAPPAPFAEAVDIGATLSSVSRELKRRSDLLRQHQQGLEAEVVRRTAALVDESERRKSVEEQLRQSQKMEAVGQLTGGIARDFNNMLAATIGSLDLLSRRLAAEDAKSRRYLDAAKDGARRAALLTQRLLAFSRQQPLRPETLDVNALIAGISELVRGSLGGKVLLKTVLGDDVWRTHADPNQLENVILNLAVNARDAMPDGGKLTIGTQNAHLDDHYERANSDIEAGEYVLIAVTDTGTGMSSDVIAKAFDPFFTTKEVGKGTGLGLSQVYGFVRQTGGHVRIYSEPGQGTTVKIYLPRLASARAEPPVRVTPASALAAAAGETILVVEDDDAVRQVAVDALTELGYRVLAADGASAALRLLASQPEIALMLTDVVMPEINGRKLADEACRLRPDLEVVFTMGYTRDAVVHNGVLDPGVALLGKLFTIDELAASIAEQLRPNGTSDTGYGSLTTRSRVRWS